MNLNEAKRILKNNGYIVEAASADYVEKTIDLLESDKLKELAHEILKFKFEGKPAFPIERFGEAFQGYKTGFMIRIQIPNSDDTGTFLDIRSEHTNNYMGKKYYTPDGFSAGMFGYFWDIVKAMEQIGIYKNWTTMFRTKEQYFPLDQLIPFLEDLLKIWDEDFYKIVYKISRRREAEDIARDIANYKGSNWSGD